MPKIFKDFTGEYEKEFYDIQLPSGEIIKECWPNAGFMNTLGEDGKQYGPGECKIRRSEVGKYHK